MVIGLECRERLLGRRKRGLGHAIDGVQAAENISMIKTSDEKSYFGLGGEEIYHKARRNILHRLRPSCRPALLTRL
jgi:hypothetical protein